MIYIFAFVAYLVFVQKYSSVNREFHSPLGVIGAYYGIVIFAVGFIATVGFQGKRYVPIVFFIIYLIVMAIYYFLYALKNQKFSADEQKALFTAYIINGKQQKDLF
jgi:L-asparagine transporter-like permease